MEKTNKRVVAAIAALTLAFAAFAGGYFIGHRQISGGYVVMTELGSPEPVIAPDAAPYIAERLVNINTADSEQLQVLNGIGPVLAERIIEYRETCGEFRYTYELLDVKGIGVNLYMRIENNITV
jgi:competence protein ComEA